LTNPFPALAKYAEGVNLDKMDSTEHSHTAYIVLLLKYFNAWKQSHDGKLPSSYAEKNEFRNIVIRGARKPDEENFNEAYKNALKACAPYRIPSNTQDILNDPKAVTINANSTKFWILAHALKGFVENEGAGLLPLSGSLSDMTATTEGYITLQTLYQTKANEDVAAVTARVKAALAQIGKPEDFISAMDIKTFCKNANFLNCIRYRSLDEERKAATAKSSLFATQLASAPEETSFNIVWYFMLRAADRFYTEHKRYPGSDDATVQQDAVALKAIVDKLLAELSITVPIDEKYVKEIVRFGAAELHPIASFIGGVASEEVIKAITHMYTPMNNTFVMNGLNSTSLTVAV
jgi:amyloid beta precursor protein binding protein 1